MDYKDIGIPINTLSIHCLLGTWQILSNTLQGIFVFSPMYCTVLYHVWVRSIKKIDGVVGKLMSLALIILPLCTCLVG
jgi:hypothetical protein